MEQATEKQIMYAHQLGIDNPEKFSKQALRELIDAKVGKKYPKEQIVDVEPSNAGKQAFKGGFDNKSMYVSYAKDLYIAIKDTEACKKLTPLEVMGVAVGLVKQAMQSF